MNLRGLLSDALILAGGSGIVWGLWQVTPPAAWLTGGLMVAAYGFLLEWRAPRQGGDRE